MRLFGEIQIAPASLTASTTYNLACLAAPTNQRVGITGFGFFGNYNAAGTPGLLSFCTASSQGSSGTSLTPYPYLDPETSYTFQSSWLATPSSAELDRCEGKPICKSAARSYRVLGSGQLVYLQGSRIPRGAVYPRADGDVRRMASLRRIMNAIGT